MASFLARALSLSPVVPPSPVGACIRAPNGVTPLRHVRDTDQLDPGRRGCGGVTRPRHGGSGEFRISGSYISLTGIDISNGGGNNLHIAPESEDIRQIYIANNTIHDLAPGPGAAIKIKTARVRAWGPCVLKTTM
ncbi:MAG: hypothetical protein IIC71_10220 [Acidobacteria bacterium]|nr:hypothetical protein [Acidobacteriota bacterium]